MPSKSPLPAPDEGWSNFKMDGAELTPSGKLMGSTNGCKTVCKTRVATLYDCGHEDTLFYASMNLY